MTNKEMNRLAVKHYNRYLKQGCRSRECVHEMLVRALKELNMDWKGQQLIELMRKEV